MTAPYYADGRVTLWHGDCREGGRVTALDPLADVFDGTADAPLPRVWIHGGPSWAPILLPHPDDPRWKPIEEAP